MPCRAPVVQHYRRAAARAAPCTKNVRQAVALCLQIVYTWGRKLHKRNRGMNMLTLRGIITLVILAVLFALAVVWISRQGGWKGEGCSGNCASCHSHCEDPDAKKK